MEYWSSGTVLTGFVLAALLLAAEGLRRVFPLLTRWCIPACIIAGLVGLALGPDVLALEPFDRRVLESVVYHGLAITFIAVGLQEPHKGKAGAGVRSLTFGIPFMEALQAFVGLAVLLPLGFLMGRTLHPGLGVMLTLGFEQGPGQALSLGAAWEQAGMADGAQVGLIYAAVGYLWSVVFGVALVAWGKRRWRLATGDEGTAPPAAGSTVERLLPAGALDHLSRQVVAVAGCYLLTWAACKGLAFALQAIPDISAMVWGFHFIIGALVAMGVRALLGPTRAARVLDDRTLGRVGGLVVDFMTCAALAAIQIAVLKANWVPILLVTSVGGFVTLVACVWLSGRAFPDAPFEHCVVWFGMSTGTLPMGLALLRTIDPDMRSTAPMSAVLGSAVAIVFAAPVLLFIIPATVASWPESYPLGGYVGLAVSGVYTVLMVVLWRWIGPLRFLRPWKKAWVDEHPAAIR